MYCMMGQSVAWLGLAWLGWDWVGSLFSIVEILEMLISRWHLLRTDIY